MRSQPPPNSTLGKLWEIDTSTLRRQKLARDKADCYADEFLALIKARIPERYSDPERQRAMQKFASTTVNVTRSIADAVAVNYSQGIRRTLSNASDDEAKVFADLVTESGAELQQADWGVSSWLCGPTLVIPYVNATTHRLMLSVVRPDQYDAQLGRGRSLLSVLWRIDDAGQWAHMTPTETTYYSDAGEPTGEVFAHGLGYVPAAVMRSRAEIFGGFWGAACGRGLLDASIDAGVTYAQLQWYRTVQVGYLTTLAGEGAKFGSGQSIVEPEVPVTYDGDPQSMSVSVISRDTDPARFLAHIYAIIGFQTQQHGIPPSEVTFQQDASNWGALSLSIRSEKLAHLRARHAPHLLRGEHDLWPIACDIVNRSPHESAGKLPTRQDVARRLIAEFPELEGTADPATRLELFVGEQRHGFTNDVEYYQNRHPTLSAAECRARIDENREAYFRGIEEARSRQIPFDPEKGVISIAEQQGALGGLTRAANAAHQENT